MLTITACHRNIAITIKRRYIMQHANVEKSGRKMYFTFDNMYLLNKRHLTACKYREQVKSSATAVAVCCILLYHSFDVLELSAIVLFG